MANGKNRNGYVDREASKLPYIRSENTGRVIPVKFGVIGWVFIITTFGLIGGETLFAKHILAGETNSKNIKILNRNIGKIDEQQRATDQSVQYIVEQLTAIIKADDKIDGPTQLPKLEPSKLENLEDE